MRDDQLRGDTADGGTAEIFHSAHAHTGFKDDQEQGFIIHTGSQHAEFFALLVNTVEVFLVDEICNRLIGEVSA